MLGQGWPTQMISLATYKIILVFCPNKKKFGVKMLNKINYYYEIS
jgi:hypothetical protein